MANCTRSPTRCCRGSRPTTYAWVWGLLTALMALGFSQTRQRRLAPWRLLMLPLVLLGLGLWSMAPGFMARPLSALAPADSAGYGRCAAGRRPCACGATASGAAEFDPCRRCCLPRFVVAWVLVVVALAHALASVGQTRSQQALLLVAASHAHVGNTSSIDGGSGQTKDKRAARKSTKARTLAGCSRDDITACTGNGGKLHPCSTWTSRPAFTASRASTCDSTTMPNPRSASMRISP